MKTILHRATSRLPLLPLAIALSAHGACPNLAGPWTVSDDVTVLIKVTGQSDQTQRFASTGSVDLTQSGCTVRFWVELPDPNNPGGIYRTERVGTIAGDTVTFTGIGVVPVNGYHYTKNSAVTVGKINGNRIDGIRTYDVAFSVSGPGYTIYVTLTGSGSETWTGSAPPTAPTITTPSPLPAGTVGAPYSHTLAATGGTTPYSWSIASGTLPSGLTLSSGGEITGTPGLATTANFTVRVTGNNGGSSMKDLSLTIHPSATLTVQANPPNGGTASGSGIFPIGSQQQISASSSPCFLFTGWNDGNKDNPRTITVPAGGATYTAEFLNILNNSVTASPAPNGVKMYAIFAPQGNVTLQEAATICGVDHFNWIQFVTSVPTHWTVTSGFLGAGSTVTPPPPLLDPIPTSNPLYYYQVTSSLVPPSVPPMTYNHNLFDPPFDDQVFYWNEPAERQSYETPRGLPFFDTPKFESHYLPQNQDYLQFQTMLVGVRSDGSYISWPGIGTAFSWRSNTRCDTQWVTIDGGVSVVGYFKLIDDAGTPDVLAGNVFDVAVDSPFTIVAASNPTNGGVVTGSGVYIGGASAIVTATAKSGYVFRHWTENGAMVSSSSNYSFMVQGPRTLVASFADVRQPELTITNPPSDLSGSTEEFVFGGTAHDNEGVASVWYRLNTNDWEPATGTEQWQAPVALIPGTNVFRVYALDAASNQSPNLKRTVFRIVKEPITLRTEGCGSIAGKTNGQLLQIGRNYMLTGVPCEGWRFDGWSGSTSSASATLTFMMQSNCVLRAHFTDVTAPTVAVASPPANSSTTNEVLIVSGTAHDNVGVASVWYRLNTNTWELASGTGNWQAPVALMPGTNMLEVYALDAASIQSPHIQFTVFRIVKEPIMLRLAGCGSIAGKTSGQLLQIGRNYAVTAAPCQQFLFSHWSGGVGLDPDLTFLTDSARVTFRMEAGLVLQANFRTNQFRAGTYRGLFYELAEVRNESSGSFTLTVDDQGIYTAELQTAGQRHSMSGRFDFDGKATNVNVGECCTTNPVTVEWALDLDPTRTNDLTGRLTPGSGAWEAQLLGDLAPVYGANASPFKGKYTLVIPGSHDPGVTDVPTGDGYGSVKVNRTGLLTLVGTLADGKPITQSAQVSTNGHWPLYVSLYGGKGSLLCWAQFSTNPPPADPLHGERVLWVRPAITNTASYPNGFEVVTSLSGYPYKATSPVLPIGTNGSLVFMGGNLLAPLTNRVMLTETNTVIPLDSQPLTMVIVRTNGFFNGTIELPGTNGMVRFQGAIYQSQTNGSGFFKSQGQSGQVIFGPAQ
jgi:hypothetical protein